MRIVFAPFSIGLGLLAAMLGKRVFNMVWGMVDEEEAPDPKQRDVPIAKLLAAGALQGVIFRLTRIFVDRGVRRIAQGLTGRWPGEKRPEPT